MTTNVAVRRCSGAMALRAAIGQLLDTVRAARQHLRQIHSRPIGLHRHRRIGALVEGQDPRQQFAPFVVESLVDGQFGEHAPLRAQFRGSQHAAGHF